MIGPDIGPPNSSKLRSRPEAGAHINRRVARMMRDEADHQPARQASATRQMAWNLTHPDHIAPALNASVRASATAADSTQVARLKREIAIWAGRNGEPTPDLSNVTDIKFLTSAAKSGRLKFKATTDGAAPFNSEAFL